MFVVGKYAKQISVLPKVMRQDNKLQDILIEELKATVNCHGTEDEPNGGTFHRQSTFLNLNM